MVVLSKLVLTGAVVAPALAFDFSHVRFGHPVHMIHEKAKANKALAAANANADAPADFQHHEARKVPTGFEGDGIVKHHFHHSQDVLEPRDETANDPTTGGADSEASADTGSPDPANEAHDATPHEAAHDSHNPATPATPPAAVNAAAQVPPASHSTSAAAAVDTHKVTPPKSQAQNNDFFSNLLNLVFKSPNHVDKAVTNSWNAVGKLFVPTTAGAATPAKPPTPATHSRRFETEDAEELFERDLPEEDLELFERDFGFPEDVEELEARDFDEELMELEARNFDVEDELELEARDFDDEMELEARDFDDEVELEARDFDDELELEARDFDDELELEARSRSD